MTNLTHLLNSIERAKEEEMTLVENHGVKQEGYTVIHDGRAYQIKVEEDEIVNCNCPHHYHRGVICKHMIKVSLIKNLDIRQLHKNDEEVI